MHTLLLSLVALGDGPLREARLDLVVLLDKSAAEAPVTDAAIVHATAFDAESLTDLTTLHHGVTRSRVLVDGLNKTTGIVLHPTTASHTVDRAEYKSIAVAGIGGLHSRVSHTIGGFTQDYGEFIRLPIVINCPRDHIRIQGQKVPRRQESQGEQLQRLFCHSWFWTLGP